MVEGKKPSFFKLSSNFPMYTVALQSSPYTQKKEINAKQNFLSDSENKPCELLIELATFTTELMSERQGFVVNSRHLFVKELSHFMEKQFSACIIVSQDCRVLVYIQITMFTISTLIGEEGSGPARLGDVSKIKQLMTARPAAQALFLSLTDMSYKSSCESPVWPTSYNSLLPFSSQIVVMRISASSVHVNKIPTVLDRLQTTAMRYVS